MKKNTHTQLPEQLSSFRASPFCPHCLTWSYHSAWTHHVLWNHGGPWLAHGGPLLTNHLYHRALQGYHREGVGHPSQTQGHRNNLPTRWEIIRNYSLLPCWFSVSDPFLKLAQNWNSASLCNAIHLQTDHIADIFALHICCNSPDAKARAPNQPKIQYLYTLTQNDTGLQTAPSVKTYLKPTMNQWDEMSVHRSLCHGKHRHTCGQMAEHGELRSLLTSYLCQRLQAWMMIFRRIP